MASGKSGATGEGRRAWFGEWEGGTWTCRRPGFQGWEVVTVSRLELTLGWKAPCREPKETAGGRPGGRPGTAGGKAVYGCGENGTSPIWGWRCSHIWSATSPLASTLSPQGVQGSCL